MTTVRRLGNFGIIDHGTHVNTFEINGFTKTAQPGVFPLNQNKLYERQPMQYGEFKFVPYGDTNSMPIELRDMLDDNNFAGSILKRRRNILLGMTDALYETSIEDNQIVRKWVQDSEISSWLKSWKTEYLRRSTVDYIHTDGYMTKYHRNLGARIGKKPFIAKLSHVSIAKARLEWPEDGENVKNIITGDFVLNDTKTFKRYPVFDESQPFINAIAMSYSNMYSFCRDFYSHASWFGSMKWIKLASSIAELITNFNINAAAIRLHIESPPDYWKAEREKMMEKAALEGKQFSEKDFETYKDKVFEKFSETLTGIQNVGKFMSTESTFNSDANDFVGWKVTPIDQKIKEFIDAQIAIANKADSVTTSGMGLHPSLSNIMVDGKLASGSEMLYALKLYLATDIDIDEDIICSQINKSISINWPEKTCRIGFYRPIIKTEDTVAPADRTKNKI